MEDVLYVTRQLTNNGSSFKSLLANGAFDSDSSLTSSILHASFHISLSLIMPVLKVGLWVTHALVVKHRISLLSCCLRIR